jgi:hypothetical protein
MQENPRITIEPQTIKPANNITDLEQWKKEIERVHYWRELGIKYIGGSQ